MLKRSYIVLLFLLVGCGAQGPAPVAPPPPYLLHLPGIGGERSPDRHLVQGFRDGGYTGEIEIYDWTDHDPGLPALVSYERNQRESQIIADKIIAVRRASPNRTIILTGHSGGTGLAVWALEKLPPDVRVDRVVLLSSALSPGYDLSPALRHVNGQMFNFWSQLDTLVLSAGTMLFGTIDGVKAPAAGFSGFVLGPKADAVQYQKLVQIPYDSSWMKWGNNGGHIGVMTEKFSSHVLSPLVAKESLTDAQVFTLLIASQVGGLPRPARPPAATTRAAQ